MKLTDKISDHLEFCREIATKLDHDIEEGEVMVNFGVTETAFTHMHNDETGASSGVRFSQTLQDFFEFLVFI